MSGSALYLDSSHVFRFVLDTVPVPCWIHAERVVRYANPALARLVGAPAPDGLMGRRATELLAPHVHSAFELRVSRLLAGQEVPHDEQQLVLANGEHLDVEVISAVASFEGYRSILSFFHDISEQRRAEMERRESERRFRRLVEGDMVGIVELSAAGIVEANQAFLNMIGRAREELQSGQLKWESITPPEYCQIDREKLDELLATGESKPFEKECLRPDGSRVPVLVASSLIAEEPEWRAICLVTDLTDRRKLQEIRAEKLRLETVGVLAAGMAHNLNNLLTAVIGNASLLMEQRLIPANSRARGIVDDIIESGDRAARLTAQLLAYAGQGRFIVGATDVREVIEGQVDRMKIDIPPNIRLSIELADDLPVIVADSNQLRHLVQGLLINAIEAVGAGPDGFISVKAHVERLGENEILTRSGEPLPPGEYCVIEVRDNGSGMDPNTLAHAFDPFFSTKFPGRGLGLAAIAGIVRASRGAIQVSSFPGAGSVFQVYLPAGHSG